LSELKDYCINEIIWLSSFFLLSIYIFVRDLGKATRLPQLGLLHQLWINGRESHTSNTILFIVHTKLAFEKKWQEQSHSHDTCAAVTVVVNDWVLKIVLSKVYIVDMYVTLAILQKLTFHKYQ